MARESVGPALLAIDHADGRADDEPGVANRLDGLEQRPAGGHDVLHEADGFDLLEWPLDAVRGAVLLRRVPDHEEREPRDERRGRGEDDAAEDGRGKAVGVRLVLTDRGGDPLAELGEEVGASLEAVLVEVVARPLARAKDEVSLEVGSGDERLAEL